MVSELDTRPCANKEAETRRRVGTRRCASEDAGPRRGVDWGLPHRLKKGTSASEDAGP